MMSEFIVEDVVTGKISYRTTKHERAGPPPEPRQPREPKGLVGKDPKAMAQKLRNSADGMEKTIQGKLHPGSADQTPTARRARIAGGMMEEGERMQRVQKVLRALADAWEDGSIPDYMRGVNSRPIVDYLLIRNENYNKYPEFYIRISTKEDIQKAIKGKPGSAQFSELWRDMRGGERNYCSYFSSSDLPMMESAVKLAKKYSDDYTVSNASDEYADAKRILRADIKRGEYISAKKWVQDASEGVGRTPEEKKMKELEDSLIGSKIPGWFPTPPELAERLVDLAGIQSGDTILEPSAGHGEIAQAIRSKHPDNPLDVIEINQTLRGILKVKGFNLVASDFLLHKDKTYNRIIMNPPFEKNQDVQHIGHAWMLLRPGGRLVSILSEHCFFATDDTCTRFLKWLEDEDGEIIDLPAGAFKSTIRSTGVKARIIVVDKPGEKPKIVPAKKPDAKAPPTPKPIDVPAEDIEKNVLCRYFRGDDVPADEMKPFWNETLDYAMRLSEHALDIHFMHRDDVKEGMIVGLVKYGKPDTKPRYDVRDWKVLRVGDEMIILQEVSTTKPHHAREKQYIDDLRSITRKRYAPMSKDRQKLQKLVVERKPVPWSLLEEYDIGRFIYEAAFEDMIPCGKEHTYPLTYDDSGETPPRPPEGAEKPQKAEIKPAERAIKAKKSMEEMINIKGYPKKLHPHQKEATRIFIERKKGIIQLPTGQGKSECAIGAWALMGRPRTLFIAPQQQLVFNIKDRLEKYNIPNVTYWYADFKDATGNIVVTTYASARLHHELFAGRDLVICDEVHWMKGDVTAMQLLPILARVPNVMGISATALGDPEKPTVEEKRILEVMPLIYNKLPSEVREYMADVIIHVVPVQPRGQDEYLWEELHTKRTQLYRKLRATGVRDTSHPAVSRLMTKGDDEQRMLAKTIMKISSQITNLNENLPEKVEKIVQIVGSYPKGEKILVAMGREDGVQIVHQALQHAGFRSLMFISKYVKGPKKLKVLSEWGKTYDIAVSMNQLREGIDIPELKVLIMSATKGSKSGKLPISLDLIQTIGRITRKDPSGRAGNAYIVFNTWSKKDIGLAKEAIRLFGQAGKVQYHGDSRDILAGASKEYTPEPAPEPEPVPEEKPLVSVGLPDTWMGFARWAATFGDYRQFYASTVIGGKQHPDRMKKFTMALRVARDRYNRPYTLNMFHAESILGIVRDMSFDHWPSGAMPEPRGHEVAVEPMQDRDDRHRREAEEMPIQTLAQYSSMVRADPQGSLSKVYPPEFWKHADVRLRKHGISVVKGGEVHFDVPSQQPPGMAEREEYDQPSYERTILSNEEALKFFAEVGLDLPAPDREVKRFRPLCPRGMTRTETRLRTPITIMPVEDGKWIISNRTIECLFRKDTIGGVWSEDNVQLVKKSFREHTLSKLIAKQWNLYERQVKQKAHDENREYVWDEARFDYNRKFLCMLKKVGR